MISSGSGKNNFPNQVEKSFDKVSTWKEERNSIEKYPLLNFDKDIIPPIPSLLFLSKVKHENLSRLWNWQLAWEMMCCVSQNFVRINKYLKNENTVICQESFQSSLPAMCTQTQDVLKTFRMNIFLLFLLLFFRSAELWVHSSTAVGVSGYILSSARISDPDQARMYLTNTRLVMPWNLPTNQSNSTLSSYQVPLPIDITVHWDNMRDMWF